MRILILGVDGMLGSRLSLTLSEDSGLKVIGTSRRGSRKPFKKKGLTLINPVYADKFDELKCLIEKTKPDLVINCIGIVKQLDQSKDHFLSIMINSLLPHHLDKLCQDNRAKFIHFSTDCVFSGREGNYKESHSSDAEDLYGRSKYLGEVSGDNALTIRTSIIGHEISSKNGLVEWFLSQDKEIKGYTDAIFSGLTTDELSLLLHTIITEEIPLKGIVNFSSSPISKFDLLSLIKTTYKKDIKIIPDSKIKLNRSLDNSLFKKITSLQISSWARMIDTMYLNYKKQEL